MRSIPSAPRPEVAAAGVELHGVQRPGAGKDLDHERAKYGIGR